MRDFDEYVTAAEAKERAAMESMSKELLYRQECERKRIDPDLPLFGAR